jgi:integrase
VRPFLCGVGDYFQHRERWWLRLHEKGGKRHEAPCHPSLEVHLDDWIKATRIAAEKKKPLFRCLHKGDNLTPNAMSRFDIFQMIKRRAKEAGLPYSTCCHTFRATGITTYFLNGERWNMPRPSPITNRRERPSSTIALEKNYRWKKWSRSKFES